MRKLTFVGFLKRYCQELAGEDTLSVARLCRLAATSNPRLAEPLFLYAVLREQTRLLLRSASGTSLETTFATLDARFKSPEALVDALRSGDSHLPARYHKVYRSYQSVSSKIETDRNASILMRARTLETMYAKSLTNYRIYTDLSLNPGNINAFLKNADATKVSRSTARAILDYALMY